MKHDNDDQLDINLPELQVVEVPQTDRLAELEKFVGFDPSAVDQKKPSWSVN